MRQLQLNDPDNFSLVYTVSIPATCMMLNGEEVCARLTRIIVPIIFNSQIMSVSVSTSVPAGSIWEFAGTLSKIVSTAIGDSISEEKKPLFLGERNLICFDEVKADYRITILPPKWFKDISIGIYQYEGTDINTLDINLARIESKIDTLLSSP
ncbi:hypothetical protein WJM97_22330 [Okeanomitos corallinicola TIOX110]|uniref:Uncharacterized protein n=1 Tax=Okeanomitos corallinicola TIOX110 TaxID=3133117 RepID=A0ABZ2URP2_9CYAN